MNDDIETAHDPEAKARIKVATLRVLKAVDTLLPWKPKKALPILTAAIKTGEGDYSILCDVVRAVEAIADGEKRDEREALADDASDEVGNLIADLEAGAKDVEDEK